MSATSLGQGASDDAPVVAVRHRPWSRQQSLATIAAVLAAHPGDWAVVFGDTPNNLGSLGWVCPVTVAHALVLQAADEIVPSNDDDRVACTTGDFLSEGHVKTSAVGVPRGGHRVSGP